MSDAPGPKLFTTIETRFIAEGDEMDLAAQAEALAIAATTKLEPRRFRLNVTTLSRWGVLMVVGAGVLVLGGFSLRKGTGSSSSTVLVVDTALAATTASPSPASPSPQAQAPAVTPAPAPRVVRIHAPARRAHRR